MSDKLIEPAEIKELVRARYGGIAARADTSCCAPATSSCCDTTVAPALDDKAREMGYSAEELAAVPDGANLGLGCGNPQAIAAISPARSWWTLAAAPASTACWPHGRSGRPVA